MIVKETEDPNFAVKETEDSDIAIHDIEHSGHANNSKMTQAWQPKK